MKNNVAVLKYPIVFVCLCLFVLLPRQGQAAGFFVPHRGAKSMAMAGANITHPKLLDALWLNPAALVDTQGMQVMLDIYVGNQESSFQRADDPQRSYFADFPLAENQGDPFIGLDGPFSLQLADNGTYLFPAGIAVSWDFGIKNFVMAFGVQGALRGNERYDPLGPQRYSAVQMDPVTAHYQLAAAYKINSMVDVGIILENNTVAINQAMAITADPIGSEDPAMDAIVDIHATDNFNLTFGAAVRVYPTSWLDLAASFTTGGKTTPVGTIAVTFGEGILALADNDIYLDGDRIDLGLKFPFIGRLAANFHFNDINIECATYYERWRTYTGVDVDLSNVTLYSDTLTAANVLEGPTTFDALTFDRSWQDIFRFSLGGEYWLTETLALRAGSFFEQSAIPTASLDVSRLDLPKIGVSGGFGIELGIVTLDAAIGYVAMIETTVTDSEILVMHAYDSSYNEPIANGVYNGSYLTAAVSARVALPWL